MSGAVSLEVYRQLFTAVAEEMGAALRRSAFSPNIKERRDYSCAVFDAHGRLVAQAAHIPVHLGSTALSVGAVLERLTLADGEVAIVNDPFAGGTSSASGSASPTARAPTGIEPGAEPPTSA